jgi:hypothetical protein
MISTAAQYSSAMTDQPDNDASLTNLLCENLSRRVKMATSLYSNFPSIHDSNAIDLYNDCVVQYIPFGTEALDS